MGDRLATVDISRKLGLCPLFKGGGELGPHATHSYLRTKWHLDQSSRLATIDMGRKLGLCPHLWGVGAGSPSNTMSLAPMPTSLPSSILIHPDIWPKQIRAENWGAVPLWGRGAGSPSNAAYLHAKCHLDPSNRLSTIH